jgi:hypothetical protein
MPVNTTWTSPVTSGGLDLSVEDVYTETVHDKLLSNLKHVGGTKGTHGACLYKSANQSIANLTITPLTFDQEYFDTGSHHSQVANTSRLTAGEAGLYFVAGSVAFALSGVNSRMARIHVNGVFVSLSAGLTSTTQPAGYTVYAWVVLAAADYVELNAWQDTGGALNVVPAGTQFGMWRVGV